MAIDVMPDKPALSTSEMILCTAFCSPDWRSVLDELSSQAWEKVGKIQSAAAVRAEAAARESGDSRREDDVCRVPLDAVCFGAVLGYSLAKTWPASLEDLDGWLERALAYGGPLTVEEGAPA